jgi:RND family efflux transporter MFP subunit
MAMQSPLVIFRGALCIALPCLVFSGCQEKPADPPQVPTASIAPVTRGDVSSTLTVAGAFQPYQEVELHAKVSGYIRRINVDIGDRVKNGQVIATLEVPELSAQVAGSKAEVRHSHSEIAQAESGVALAEANYAAVHAAYTRLSEAAKRRPGLVAEQELDDARARDLDAAAKIHVAQAALDATKEQLSVSQANQQRVQSLEDYSVVTAPFAGVVTMRYADVGSLIQAGTTSNTQAMPVVKVAQSDLLRLRMPVPEEDVPFIKVGGEVSIKLEATGKSLRGTIVRFTRELSTATRTMLVEVDVPNPDLSLSAGMTAQTTIVLQAQKNVLTVPAGAVLKGDGQDAVLLVDAADKVEKVPVTLGIQGPDLVEITHGLSENQSVIVSGQRNYQTGELVRPQRSTIVLAKQGDEQ